MNDLLAANKPLALLLKVLSRFFCIFQEWTVSMSVRKIGRGLRVRGKVYISGGKNIFIGENCDIGKNVSICANGPVHIGDNVTIGDDVRIYARNVSIGSGTSLELGVFINEEVNIGAGAWISRGCDISGSVCIQDAILGPYVRCVGEPNHPRDEATQKILLDVNAKSGGVDPALRPPHDVLIKSGSWIGINAIILKGVIVGEGAIVGAGSVVTRAVPDYSTVVGNPAKTMCEKEDGK